MDYGKAVPVRPMDESYQRGNAPATRVPIRDAVDRALMQTTELRKLLEELGVRLNPVMTPQHPIDNGLVGASGVSQAPGHDENVANNLTTLSLRLEGLAGQIVCLRDRLEI